MALTKVDGSLISGTITVNTSAGSYANSAYIHANSSFIHSNAAFVLANTVGTTSDVQHNSLGIGTSASGTSGEIRAINNITAYYSSDERLKENIEIISDALLKIKQLNGVMFDWKDDYIKSHGGEDGYFIRKHDTGIIAQQVELVLPEVVATRNDGFKAVNYEKLAGLIIQSINELSEKVEKLESKMPK